MPKTTMNHASYYHCELRCIERDLERLGVRTNKQYSHSTCPIDLDIPDEATRFRAWFLESLHTALAHVHPLIAFRALLQAYSYANDKRTTVYGSERDWMVAARNRIEDVLREVPQTAEVVTDNTNHTGTIQ